MMLPLMPITDCQLASLARWYISDKQVRVRSFPLHVTF